MTPREAIEYAKSVSFCAGCSEPQWTEDAADICGRCEHRQFFEIAIEALEMQIPKKPNSIFCPVCNFPSIIDGEYGDRYPYCYNCGQAIDWTEVEE